MSFGRTYRRQDCRFCGHGTLDPYLDLGAHPVSNGFLTAERVADERRHPLDVALCTACGASQLLQVVAAEEMYGDYSYLSSTSKPLVRHYQGMIEALLAAYDPPGGAVVVDIGANDGITLRRYPADRFRRVGVEPSSAGQFARRAGLDIIARFFDAATVDEILGRLGPAHLVTATNVFAHVDDIAGFCHQAARLLHHDGVLVVEFPYVVDTVERLYFDTIYHEHLSYLGLTPVEAVARRTGLRVIDATRVDFGASGPALRLALARADGGRAPAPAVDALRAFEAAWGIRDRARYAGFARDVAEARRALLALLEGLARDGRTIGAYTAPAKGNTLLNYLGVGPALIAVVAENNPEKIGKLTPGTHIPVVSDADFLSMALPYALLLSWNYADFFLGNAEYVKRGGRFVIPLPVPRIAP